MSIYTATEATTSANIYFLNDKNIIQGVSETGISNAIPAYDTFKEKYEELTSYDKNLSSYGKNLSTEIDTLSTSLSNTVDAKRNTLDEKIDKICANISIDLSSEITSRIETVSNLSTSLSTTTNKEFVHISGDTINGSLIVTDKIETSKAILGTVEISDTLSIANDKKVLIGKASSDYSNTFVWNATEDDYTAESIDGKGGTFNINPLHQAEGFYIGEKSLSAIISEDTEISAKAIREEIKAVSVLLTGDYALSSDISSEILEIYSKNYLASENFDFKYDGNIIWLSAGSNVLSIDAADFIKDGMLSTVELTTYAVGSDAHQALKFVFNTDQEQDPIYVDLNQLVDVYTGSEGIEIKDYKATLDFNVVGKKENIDINAQNIKTLSTSTNEINTRVNTNIANISEITAHTAKIQDYITTLSGPTNGTISKIENAITTISTDHKKDFEEVFAKIENDATFAGTIKINKTTYIEPHKTIGELIEIANSTIFRKLKNGDIYIVDMSEGFDENTFDYAKRYYDTSDTAPIRLAHKDYIVIFKSFGDNTDITKDNVHNYIKIIPAVRFYELYDLSVTVSSDYLWLSGGNNIDNGHAISGNNYFLGRNDIEDLSVKTLLADWSRVKHPTGYSLYNLSVDLSNKIYIDSDDIKGTSDLSIIKLTKEEFDKKVRTKHDILQSNTIYFVNSDYIDAYGQVLCNLVMTNDAVPSDAANKHYVDSICSDISNTTKLSVEELQRQIISNDNDIKYLSDEHDILSTSLSTSVDQICSNISTDLRNEITARNKAVSDLSTSLSNTITANYVLKSSVDAISGNALNEATKYVNTISTSLSNAITDNYVLKTSVDAISGNALTQANNYTDTIKNALEKLSSITTTSDITTICNALIAIYTEIKNN